MVKINFIASKRSFFRSTNMFSWKKLFGQITIEIFDFNGEKNPYFGKNLSKISSWLLGLNTSFPYFQSSVDKGERRQVGFFIMEKFWTISEAVYAHSGEKSTMICHIDIIPA